MTEPTHFGVILATAGIQYVIHAKRNICVLRTAATLLDSRKGALLSGIIFEERKLLLRGAVSQGIYTNETRSFDHTTQHVQDYQNG